MFVSRVKRVSSEHRLRDLLANTKHCQPQTVGKGNSWYSQQRTDYHRNGKESCRLVEGEGEQVTSTDTFPSLSKYFLLVSFLLIDSMDQSPFF
jgi:hypothetical protein